MKTHRDNIGITHREKFCPGAVHRERDKPVRVIPPDATGCNLSGWKSRTRIKPLNDSTNRVLHIQSPTQLEKEERQ